MIRFIVKNHRVDQYSGAVWDVFETIDAEVPELERRIDRGGYGNGGCDLSTLVGIEVLRPEAAPRGGEGRYDIVIGVCAACEGTGLALERGGEVSP